MGPEGGGGPVVVAVDGSKGSGRALEWALAAAALRDVPLRIVHVRGYDVPLVDGPFASVLERDESDPVVDWARDALVGRAGLPELEFVTVDGSPGRELPRLGAGAGLLVLGSRGRGGFASLLLGSNGLACAREAACPVVVVPRPAGPEAPDTAARVVLGLSAPAPDEHSVAFAFAEAGRRGARLQVVAAYPWPVLSSTPAGEFVMKAVADEETERDYAALTDDLLTPHQKRHPDVPVDVFVAPGDAARHLVDASHAADLVVVGRHRRRLAPGRILGSVTHAVLLHAACPVAVVPPETAGA
ncbi:MULTISPECIES: universal stress protein [unclassified Streptomyces]|uniref:universal stress protein n=1 Tax=unclassified Streptomyces TaxID=2593676 RepID=UPI002286C517|nr:universal stress protein [Streptomyces sp. Je 1-369]WAM00534.1 universal stress protein [Streptomyces sp. Je 1-369]